MFRSTSMWLLSALFAAPAFGAPCYTAAEYGTVRTARSALPTDAEMIAGGTSTPVIGAVRTLTTKIDAFLATSNQSCRTAEPAHVAMEDANDDLTFTIGELPAECDGVLCECQGPASSEDCKLVLCVDDLVCLGDDCFCVGSIP